MVGAGGCQITSAWWVRGAPGSPAPDEQGGQWAAGRASHCGGAGEGGGSGSRGCTARAPAVAQNGCGGGRPRSVSARWHCPNPPARAACCLQSPAVAERGRGKASRRFASAVVGASGWAPHLACSRLTGGGSRTCASRWSPTRQQRHACKARASRRWRTVLLSKQPLPAARGPRSRAPPCAARAACCKCVGVGAAAWSGCNQLAAGKFSKDGAGRYAVAARGCASGRVAARTHHHSQGCRQRPRLSDANRTRPPACVPHLKFSLFSASRSSKACSASPAQAGWGAAPARFARLGGAAAACGRRGRRQEPGSRSLARRLSAAGAPCIQAEAAGTGRAVQLALRLLPAGARTLLVIRVIAPGHRQAGQHHLGMG